MSQYLWADLNYEFNFIIQCIRSNSKNEKFERMLIELIFNRHNFSGSNVLASSSDSYVRQSLVRAQHNNAMSRGEKICRHVS
jgi:hypothetical protein